jgi:predicted GNAT family N-acyltransferase
VPNICVILVATAPELHDALQIRRRVFIEEQHVPEDLEIDEHDAEAVTTTARHVLLRLDGAAIATGRLILESDAHAHIGRVAVLAEHRGRGHGRMLMNALHDLAIELGAQAITLAAQLHAIGFYERLGYRARGDVFLDAGIEHRWMDLDLLRGRKRLIE